MRIDGHCLLQLYSCIIGTVYVIRTIAITIAAIAEVGVLISEYDVSCRGG